jgi:hypothetical protein
MLLVRAFCVWKPLYLDAVSQKEVIKEEVNPYISIILSESSWSNNSK